MKVSTLLSYLALPETIHLKGYKVSLAKSNFKMELILHDAIEIDTDRYKIYVILNRNLQ